MRVADKRLAQGGPGLTVAEIRDLLGTTRKYAVPLCEYLDRVGITGARASAVAGKRMSRPELRSHFLG